MVFALLNLYSAITELFTYSILLLILTIMKKEFDPFLYVFGTHTKNGYFSLVLKRKREWNRSHRSLLIVGIHELMTVSYDTTNDCALQYILAIAKRS